MKDCIIAMRAQTTAEKARRLLKNAHIPAELVSVDPSLTRHGCALGLCLSCAQAEAARAVLAHYHIPHGDTIGEGI